MSQNDPICRCGHPQSDHHDLGLGECKHAGEHAECACSKFRKAE